MANFSKYHMATHYYVITVQSLGQLVNYLLVAVKITIQYDLTLLD